MKVCRWQRPCTSTCPLPAKNSGVWATTSSASPKVLSFGEYPVVTLQKAREKRQEAKQLLADGIDPAAKRKIAKEEHISEVKDMFRNIALEWFEARTTDFTEKHRGTVMYRMEKYIFPVIGTEHIGRMEPLDILKVIQPIEKKGQNETARRLMQIIGRSTAMAVITAGPNATR